MPATGWVFGRATSLGSHWIYKADVSLETAQEEYKDLDGTMLVELRAPVGRRSFRQACTRTPVNESPGRSSPNLAVHSPIFSGQSGRLRPRLSWQSHLAGAGFPRRRGMALSGGFLRGGLDAGTGL